MSEKPTESVRAQLVALDIGETFAVATRLEQDNSSSADIAKATERVSNLLSPAIARAKSQTGQQYLNETVVVRSSRSYDPIIVGLVTRLP